MKNLRKIIGWSVFAAGLLVFLYPQFLLLYKDISMQRVIDAYNVQLRTLDTTAIYREMEQYNGTLSQGTHEKARDPFDSDPSGEIAQMLALDEDTVLGYIDIPKIGQLLPIYMGASSKHLSKGVGVIDSTSLPLGGESTHAVLAGHRGYTYAAFFRNINDLETGDIFHVQMSGQTLTYRIYEKEVILPTQVEKLEIVQDRDLVTLLTCHPYMVNTHRLLVKGERLLLPVSKGDPHSPEPGDNPGEKTGTAWKILSNPFMRYRLANRIFVAAGAALLIIAIAGIIRNVIRGLRLPVPRK